MQSRPQTKNLYGATLQQVASAVGISYPGTLGVIKENMKLNATKHYVLSPLDTEQASYARSVLKVLNYK